mgnify:CR=1 FL=1
MGIEGEDFPGFDTRLACEAYVRLSLRAEEKMEIRKEKKIEKFLFRHRNLIMNILVTISTIEIFGIGLNLGFHILSENLAKIIENISYAIVGSYIFYIINIAIPSYIEKKIKEPVIFLKVVYIINTAISLLDDLLGKYSNQISKEEITTILNERKAEIQNTKYSFKRKHLLELIGQVNAFASYLDSRLLKILCDIELAANHLGMDYEIEGMSYGETYSKYIKELITKIEELKVDFGEEIGSVKRKYSIGVHKLSI